MGVKNGDEQRSPLLAEWKRKEGRPDESKDESAGPSGDLETGDMDKGKSVGFGRILRLARPEAGMLIIATVALLVSSLSNVLLPTFAGNVIDVVTASAAAEKGKEEALRQVNSTILLIVAIIVTGSIATTIRAYLFSAASERVVARLKTDLFGHLITQEIAFYDVTRTGELLNRLSEDTQVIKNAATVNLSETLRSLATAVIGIGFMFHTSWQLTLLALLIVPGISFGIRAFGKYLRELSRKTQAASAVAASIAEESFGAVRTVRSFAQEQYETERYGQRVNETLKLGLQQALVSGLFYGGVSAAATLAIVAVVVYGAHLTINGHMSTGSLTAFILYSLTVGMSLASLSGIYTTVMKAVGASQRVFNLLDRVSIMANPGKKLPFEESFNSRVQIEDVWFAYPSRPNDWVLKGVNLELKAGEKVALVGPSGGGKTTIANLVERFYDPQKGTVSINGVSLVDVDHHHLHANISIVSQEPTLFNCSIEENISYGLNGSFSLEEIEKVAKMANAHDFISNFPERYQTSVGERGVRLSGGQKQRIAIARALLMDPKVLLLDEATSALDAESEYLVQDAMDRLMEGRTVLVIAHRLSTVQSADFVAVVNNGIIAEVGPHEELLSRNGIYANLVRRQLQGPTKGHTSAVSTSGEE